ncbi:hypothetical protein Pst134EA_019130 [Puccinia striiformis f. sp. tritici]|uniref:hypothetical protein n=1 Tax=Puccinia striiformis f. sp. tritici TaxID=168172 RepID=UPI000A124D5C|nr:hypothetical protein Pst134EA_019130 [Puccinia striiformis f. sp. tritici]KAH9458976.1 hypothetical protein Pst134EA_019130 [Puccinia striiformis f. sp. tritici]KAI9613804.1 hypothetical protein H4Q26_009653 [Puccinia striiformis f. sp. tritici PST-130]
MATVIKKRSSTPEQFTQPARVANGPEPIHPADVTSSSSLEEAAPAAIQTPVCRRPRSTTHIPTIKVRRSLQLLRKNNPEGGSYKGRADYAVVFE